MCNALVWPGGFNWCVYVLCVIEAIKMGACSRPSVSKRVTARVEREFILWDEYSRLGWRSNHPGICK